MEQSQFIVSIMGAGGGSLVVVTLVNGWFKWRTGASARERAKNSDLLSQRAKAVEQRDETERERDAADRKRREAEEHVSLLRRQVIEMGGIPVSRTGPSK